MHIDPEILRITFFAVVIALVFATRMTRGKARETPEGLVFSTKPIVLWTRLLFLPVYLFALFYPVITHRHNTPVWLPVVLLALLLFALYQSPGTILLTPAAVVQRFWFRADKVIEYSEVMTIQITQANRLTRVFGNNRITITHTASHSDAEGFRAELERRTGKRALV